MTPKEFNQLDFEKQDLLLYEKGTNICMFKDDWHDVKLYALDNFFVTYSMPPDHDADEIRALETPEEIEKYQVYLNLGGLVN